MDISNYGPFGFLIGEWTSGENNTGENRAPSPDRGVENTKFRQIMNFEPIEDINNHEQVLYGLRYSTMVWEEGDDDPFHEEVGYFLWDADRNQIVKSFIVPRGISVNAGGTANSDDRELRMSAKLGSTTYGLCSNPFLDEQFQTIQYDLTLNIIDNETFSYDENTQIKIKGQDRIFDHTEKNTMKRKS